jgi:hypothetical protein
MSQEKIYVLVIHDSGVGFALGRNYGIVFAEIKNARVWLNQQTALQGLGSDFRAKIVDHWKGWLPTGGWQRPKWIEGIPESEFTAYWLEHAQAEAAA